MSKLTAQPYGSAEVLREVVAIPVGNLVILLAIVLLLALHHPCVVVVVAVVDTEEVSEADLLAPIGQQPATNAVDPITTLATARLRL